MFKFRFDENDNNVLNLKTRQTTFSKAAVDMPNLAFVNAELIVQEGGLPPLVDLLASSNEGIQQQAAGALWSLSVNGAAART